MTADKHTGLRTYNEFFLSPWGKQFMHAAAPTTVRDPRCPAAAGLASSEQQSHAWNGCSTLWAGATLRFAPTLLTKMTLEAGASCVTSITCVLWSLNRMARTEEVIVIKKVIACLVLASIGGPALGAGGARFSAARDDPYGYRATVRAQMGIPRHSGYSFPDFGPRVQKCVLAYGSRQELAQKRAVATSPQDQTKLSIADRLKNSGNKVSGPPPRDVAFAPTTPGPSPPQGPDDAIKLEKRVALVIGNGAYTRVPVLANPPKDAVDIAEAFTRLGFSVVLAKDLSLERTKDVVAQFGKDVIDSDIAVVFYAGHGVEAYGENWMIPTDAHLPDNGDLRSEAINLKSLSSEVAKSKSLGLIILDACRDNPFAAPKIPAVATNTPENTAGAEVVSRSVKKGLAPTEPSGNVLIAFAAKDGTSASDGNGRNSPFTTALLKHIETPGLEITFVFRRVRDDVMSATSGAQQPYVYGSLSGTEVFLKPPLAAVDARPRP
ncbi:hypothetical protein ABH973_000058 [Bradyrhizobium ottawaense]|uniref:caspase family protein n=1 Tax=Bradyrhizobium ottawaense TaxID=931866 RepID=UPI003515AAB8